MLGIGKKKKTRRIHTQILREQLYFPRDEITEVQVFSLCLAVFSYSFLHEHIVLFNKINLSF